MIFYDNRVLKIVDLVVLEIFRAMSDANRVLKIGDLVVLEIFRVVSVSNTL